jgi:hypothetical protein
LELT